MYTIACLIGFAAGCFSLWLYYRAAVWLFRKIFTVETGKKAVMLAGKEAAKHIIKNMMK